MPGVCLGSAPREGEAPEFDALENPLSGILLSLRPDVSTRNVGLPANDLAARSWLGAV